MKPFVLEDISIFQMQIFIAAGNTLNYTHTAQLCNTTQSTVSRQLTALEKTLGLILFYKNGRSFQLTPAGKYLHKRFPFLRKFSLSIDTRFFTPSPKSPNGSHIKRFNGL